MILDTSALIAILVGENLEKQIFLRQHDNFIRR
jgi:hypothetical protein